MEKLKLKHLTGYLPYGLNIEVESVDGKEILPITGLINKDGYEIAQISNTDYYLCGPEENNFLIKPILRPLSDLTKEIEVNGEKFVPNINLSKGRVIEYENGSFWYLKTESLVSNKSGWQGAENQLELFQKLLEWHFDIYGLIEKGLAIDIYNI